MNRADGGRIGWIWLEPRYGGFLVGNVFGDLEIGLSGSGVVVDAGLEEIRHEHRRRL